MPSSIPAFSILVSLYACIISKRGMGLMPSGGMLLLLYVKDHQPRGVLSEHYGLHSICSWFKREPVCHERFDIEMAARDHAQSQADVRAGRVRGAPDAQAVCHDIEVVDLDEARVPGHQYGAAMAIKCGQGLLYHKWLNGVKVRERVAPARLFDGSGKAPDFLPVRR